MPSCRIRQVAGLTPYCLFAFGGVLSSGSGLFDGNSLVEVQNLGAEQVFVLGLQFVALGFHQVLLGFVVFHGVGLSALILFLCKLECFLAGLRGSLAAVVFADGSRSVVPGLLYLLIQGFLGIVQLQGVIVSLQAGGAHPVACGQPVEQGNAEAESDVFAEVVAHLLVESPVQRRVEVGSDAPVQVQLRVVSALRDAYAVLASLQPVFGSLYGGLPCQSYLVDFVGRGEGRGGSQLGRCFHLESFGRLQFNELAEVQQSQAVVVVGLHHVHFVLCHARLGFGNFRRRCLAGPRKAADALVLLLAQFGLSQGHIVQLLVEEHLQVGRGDVDGDVFLGLVQVGQCGFEIEFGQCVLVGQFQSGKDGYACAQREVGAVVFGVDVDGVVFAGCLVSHGGLRASPVPALACISAE